LLSRKIKSKTRKRPQSGERTGKKKHRATVQREMKRSVGSDSGPYNLFGGVGRDSEISRLKSCVKPEPVNRLSKLKSTEKRETKRNSSGICERKGQ